VVLHLMDKNNILYHSHRGTTNK